MSEPPDAAPRHDLGRWAVAARRPLSLLLVVLVVGYAAAIAMKASGVDIYSIDVQGLATHLRAWGRWTAAASIGLMILHSALPLPGEIIAIANALIYGPLLGAALTWIGAMLGAVAAYSIARYLGRAGAPPPLDRRIRERIETAATRPTTLLALRLVPVISFNLINYAAGLSGVGWWTFLWTTSIGILPMIAGTSYFGQAMLDAPLWAWATVAVLLVISPAFGSRFMHGRKERRANSPNSDTSR